MNAKPVDDPRSSRRCDCRHDRGPAKRQWEKDPELEDPDIDRLGGVDESEYPADQKSTGQAVPESDAVGENHCEALGYALEIERSASLDFKGLRQANQGPECDDARHQPHDDEDQPPSSDEQNELSHGRH